MASNAHRQIITVADSVALAKAAADRVMAKIATNNNRVAICLTGGSSPTEVYRLLATDPYRNRIPWGRRHWFIGDERAVGADDPLNNIGMARRNFLGHFGPAGHHHPIPATFS